MCTVNDAFESFSVSIPQACGGPASEGVSTSGQLRSWTWSLIPGGYTDRPVKQTVTFGRLNGNKNEIVTVKGERRSVQKFASELSPHHILPGCFVLSVMTTAEDRIPSD